MKKNSNILIYSLILIGVTVMLTNGCKKEDDSIVETGTVTDIDGNTYNTVTIGTQTWMVENLKTTKYNDGNDIPNVTDFIIWSGLSTPGYCWYENNIDNKATYGALYNWHTVNTGKLAPTGWHVPTDAEWLQLTDYLGGDLDAGDKLKEIGNTHWKTANETATNETGFTALPGGNRNAGGIYGNIGNFGFWWSANEYSANYAWIRSMGFNLSNVYRQYEYKEAGLSVRCVKD